MYKLYYNRFDGLKTQYPMHRQGDVALYWTIQHFTEQSYGNYEVVIGEEHYFFNRLKDAIDCYNGGIK